MNQPKLDTRMLLIIGLVVIVAVLFIIPRLNQGDVTTPGTGTVTDGQPRLDDSGSSGASGSGSSGLGRIVAATGVDRDGCPVNTATVFEPVERVYVVAENSNIAAGTTVFVRLYRNNQPVEDAPEITADQAYTNSCVNFVFEPTSGSRFQSGQYEAEFIVNGNAAGSVQFQIR